MATYFSILTQYGTQTFANAIANNRSLNLTHFAVGDGNGVAVTPTANQTALKREKYRATVSAISVDPRNNNQLIIELTIPENVGGFYIREMGVFDSSNKLVAVANCPESYKPTVESGSGKVQVLRMILQVASSQAVTLTVDDSAIWATRGQLTPKTLNATTTNTVGQDGHTHHIDSSSAVNSNSESTLATSKAVKIAYDKAVEGVNKANNAQTAANKAQNTANTAIPNSKKSDSVTSTSSDTVATSKAVKTAYDKAIEGVNKANNAQTAASNAQNTANAAIPNNQKSNSVTSVSSDTVATSVAVKTAYDKAVSVESAVQFQKIYANAQDFQLDLTSRAAIISAFGDKYRANGYLMLTSHNHANGNINGLPLPNKSFVQIYFALNGGYSFIEVYYPSLKRRFFTNVNFNNETLVLNWIEQLTNTGDQVLEGSLRHKTINYFRNNALGYEYSGFYRANGATAPNSDKKLPSMEMHITHPEDDNKNRHARGIGFSYGSNASPFFVSTTAWDNNGEYLGQKEILTELHLSHIANGADKTKAASEYALGLVAKMGLPVGATLAFPKAITNPVGFLRADGSTFSSQTFPDLYRALGNSNKLPDLTRSDVGELAYFPFDAIPDGWLSCDGKTITSQAYPELYRKLGNKYGANGKLPDAQDRFIRNAGNGLTIGETQEDAIKTHTIQVPDAGAQGATMGVFHYGERGVRNDQGYNELTYQGENETRPKAIVFKLCIKAKNTFDDVVFWVKAADGVSNQALLDASTLAQQLQDKANLGHTHHASEITDFVEQVDTRIKRVTRRDYSKTIKGTSTWDSGTSKSIQVTGQVIIYPDGKIEQYFHFKAMRVMWFDFEEAIAKHGRSQEIPVQLWTTMPHKIVNVQAQFSRPVANNITAGAESAEWIPPSWNLQKQGSFKDKCYVIARRFTGDTDEPIDLYIKVEGY